jgi:hypothetical protein
MGAASFMSSSSPDAAYGSAAGSVAGSFLPIPGGSMIGSLVGKILGGLIGGKPSADDAFLGFAVQGGVPRFVQLSNESGKVSQTVNAAAMQLANALNQVFQVYAQHGIYYNLPNGSVFVVNYSQRDGTRVKLCPGTPGGYSCSGQGTFSTVGPPDGQAGAQGVLQFLSQYQRAQSMVNPNTVQWMSPPANSPLSYPVDYGSFQNGVPTTYPYPGAVDYNSQQQQTTTGAGTTSSVPAPAAPAPVMAGLFSSPVLLIGGVVLLGVVLMVSQE